MNHQTLILVESCHAQFQLAHYLDVSWVENSITTTDSETWRNYPGKKVIIKEWSHCTNPDLPPATDSHIWYENADLIIVTYNEALGTPWHEVQSICEQWFGKASVVFITNGTIQDTQRRDVWYNRSLIWFDLVAWGNTDYITKTHAVKPYLFDAIMGQIKPHREYVWHRLCEDSLLDKSLVALYRVNADINSYDDYHGINDRYNINQVPDFYESPNLNNLEDPLIQKIKSQSTNRNGFSCTGVGKNLVFEPGRRMWLSLKTSQGIYDSSWYSIVTETSYENYDFLSEKVAKAILAKRIFVLFRSYGQLALLRSHGFKTFDGIIDETYDTIDHAKTRFNLAWQQVQYLAHQDPVMLYTKADEILEHNRTVLLNITDRHLAIRNFISPYLL
jgi:hypothetical protein